MLVIAVALLAMLASRPAVAQDVGLRLRDASGGGVEIVAVESSLAATGLQAGDRIVAAGGQPVADVAGFQRIVRDAGGGSTLPVRVSRGSWEKDVALPLPSPQPFGLALRDRASGIGVEIDAVVAGSAAALAGLAAGDRIVAIEGARIVDAASLRDRLRASIAERRTPWLTIERAGWTKDVRLAAPGTLTAPAESAGVATTASPVADEVEAANALYDAGRWPQAEVAYRALPPPFADDARVRGRLCHAQVMQQRFAEAVETCRAAAALPGAAPDVHQNLAFALFRLGRPADAVESYRRAIALAPSWTAPYEGLGAAEFALRHYAEAESAYRGAVQRAPDSATAWQGLGDALGEQAKSAESIDAYRRAQSLGGSSARLSRSLGWQLQRNGQLASAEDALQDAHRRDPRDTAALLALADVQWAQGKREPARAAWERVSLLDQSGTEGAIARRNLASTAASASAASAAPANLPSGSAATDDRVAIDGTVPGAWPRPPANVSSSARASAPSPSGLARVAIGDFAVKAANAGAYIGEGLREMLLTSLHGSGRFIVVERIDIKGLAAEQALSRSRMARAGEAIPEGAMEVADVLVYGAVTEFEPEVRGGGLSLGMPNVPLTLGMQSKSAHMAIDVRIVDVASGRVIATTRITGEAQSAQASVGATIQARGAAFPASLGGFQNTPMEKAIRDCIDKSTAYIVASTPATYFRNR